MGALLGVAVALALAWGAPAAAVIIASGDGTGNASAPPDDPGWDNVVNLSGLTGVYLGNGWVLTANHVGARNMIIGSDVYEPVPGSKVRLETTGSIADLALFQILRDPGLPDVEIRTSAPPPTTEIVMIGRGRNRGADPLGCTPPRQGWLWGTGNSMRWGTNAVEENGINVSISGTLTRSFSTEFSASRQTDHEGQAANGDSGGAVFVKDGATWELAGILFAIDSCQEYSARYADLTYAADLSFYFDQIDDIASVPACNDGIDQDGDGLVDYPDDWGCDDPLDPFETSDALPCDDGIDNDEDELVDYSNDPGCLNPSYFTENPQCQDGIDNDADGKIDYDGGLSALGHVATEPDPNCAGQPWQDYEWAVWTVPGWISCGLGAELALLLPPLMWMRRWRRR